MLARALASWMRSLTSHTTWGHAIVTLLSYCCHTFVTLFSWWCYTVFILLLHCYCTVVILLLVSWMRSLKSQTTWCYAYFCRFYAVSHCSTTAVIRFSCFHYSVITLLLHCCYIAVPLLLHCCHSAVTMFSCWCVTCFDSTSVRAFTSSTRIRAPSVPQEYCNYSVTTMQQCNNSITALYQQCKWI
jgi:hypothetical protein